MREGSKKDLERKGGRGRRNRLGGGGRRSELKREREKAGKRALVCWGSNNKYQLLAILNFIHGN